MSSDSTRSAAHGARHVALPHAPLTARSCRSDSGYSSSRAVVPLSGTRCPRTRWLTRTARARPGCAPPRGLNSKFDRMASFMRDVAADADAPDGSRRSVGIERIKIVPHPSAHGEQRRLDDELRDAWHGEVRVEEREARDRSRRRTEVGGPGSSIARRGAVERPCFAAASTVCEQRTGESSSSPVPRLVLKRERSVDGRVRTVVRDEENDRPDDPRPTMRKPSFWGEKVSLSFDFIR